MSLFLSKLNINVKIDLMQYLISNNRTQAYVILNLEAYIPNFLLLPEPLICVRHEHNSHLIKSNLTYIMYSGGVQFNTLRYDTAMVHLGE